MSEAEVWRVLHAAGEGLPSATRRFSTIIIGYFRTRFIYLFIYFPQLLVKHGAAQPLKPRLLLQL